MDAITLVVLIIVIVCAIAAIWVVSQRSKVHKLRARYGPEYDRVAQQERDPRRIAKILQMREKRVAKYNIRTLTAAECADVARDWRAVQEHFVDDPHGAVEEADTLVHRTLQARGYPMADFDQQAEDLSVDHPHVVENYRLAHAIARRRREASTEDLRRAMQHYRNLLENIIDAHVMQTERKA